MNCDEIQETIALYCDDGLNEEDRARCDQHLEVCPVCRAHVTELRAVRLRLATMARLAPPADLIPEIQWAVRADAFVLRARRRAPTSEIIADILSVWLQPRIARYAFSSIASLILFGSVFLALRPHMIALHEAAATYSDFIVENNSGPYDINQPISQSSYAALRTPYNSESPSLNPKGGIATLELAGTPSLESEGDDHMVVVADVFSNGVASLTDVMHAPRDKRMLDDFQAALRNNAVFVPAALDRRPETMRVVFSIQRVEVRDRKY
jgi:hypothetical protein